MGSSVPPRGAVGADYNRTRKRQNPTVPGSGAHYPEGTIGRKMDELAGRAYGAVERWGQEEAARPQDPFSSAKVGPMPPPLGQPTAAATPPPGAPTTPSQAQKAADKEQTRTTAAAAAAASQAGAPPAGQGAGQTATGTGTTQPNPIEREKYETPKAVMKEGKITLSNIPEVLGGGAPVTGRVRTGVIGETLARGGTKRPFGGVEWQEQNKRNLEEMDRFGGGVTPYDEKRAFIEWSQFKTANEMRRKAEDEAVAQLDRSAAEALASKTRAEALTADPFAREKAEIAGGAAGEIAKQTGKQREETTRMGAWQAYQESLQAIDDWEEQQLRVAANDQARAAQIKTEAQARRDRVDHQYQMFQSGVLGQRMPREETNPFLMQPPIGGTAPTS